MEYLQEVDTAAHESKEVEASHISVAPPRMQLLLPANHNLLQAPTEFQPVFLMHLHAIVHAPRRG